MLAVGTGLARRGLLRKSSFPLAPQRKKRMPPTYPPPPAQGLAPVLDRNIDALRQRRFRKERAASRQERVADAITRFTGSMWFVYIHLTVFGFWIVANLHWIPGIPAWDDPSSCWRWWRRSRRFFYRPLFLSPRTEWPRLRTSGLTWTYRSASSRNMNLQNWRRSSPR